MKKTIDDKLRDLFEDYEHDPEQQQAFIDKAKEIFFGTDFLHIPDDWDEFSIVTTKSGRVFRTEKSWLKHEIDGLQARMMTIVEIDKAKRKLIDDIGEQFRKQEGL